MDYKEKEAFHLSPEATSIMEDAESRAEARIIMKVQEQIMSPRFGGPIIGAIHEFGDEQ